MGARGETQQLTVMQHTFPHQGVVNSQQEHSQQHKNPPGGDSQNNSNRTLSTLLGSTASTTESYSCLSTSASRRELHPHDLVQPNLTLDTIFHSYKDILVAMTESYFPWDAIHHHSFC